MATKKSPKYERCVVKVKKTAGARAGRVNPYAVCHASTDSKKGKKA